MEKTMNTVDYGLTITLPLTEVKVGNLINILEAKGELIRHALQIDDLRFELGEGTISFPWFSTTPTAEEAHAYSSFISALCKMSKEQKRINHTEKPVTNERYSFRCFLLRLGFIGEEYKMDRKVLLRNLTGSTAFRTAPTKEEETCE